MILNSIIWSCDIMIWYHTDDVMIGIRWCQESSWHKWKFERVITAAVRACGKWRTTNRSFGYFERIFRLSARPFVGLFNNFFQYFIYFIENIFYLYYMWGWRFPQKITVSNRKFHGGLPWKNGSGETWSPPWYLCNFTNSIFLLDFELRFTIIFSQIFPRNFPLRILTSP